MALLGDLEQLTLLLHLILFRPGICLHELEDELLHKYGVNVSG